MYRIKRGLFFKLIIASWTVFSYSALIQCCGFVIQSNMSKIIQDCFLLWGRSWQRICHGPRCRCDGGRAGSHVLLLSVEHTDRTLWPHQVQRDVEGKRSSDSASANPGLGWQCWGTEKVEVYCWWQAWQVTGKGLVLKLLWRPRSIAET